MHLPSRPRGARWLHEQLPGTWRCPVSAETVYGVRGPDPRNTVVKAEDREQAAEMAEDFPGDVVVVSRDGGQTWEEAEK